MSCTYSAIHDGMPYFNKNYPTQEQIDAVVAARRNPLTPQMERAKMVATKKYSVPKIPDVLYHLITVRPNEVPTPFYVGITRKDRASIREQEHLKGIANEANLKEAYVYAREMQDQGYEVRFEVLGYADDDFSETDLLVEYLELGYPIQQDTNKTVSIKRKKKLVEDVAKAMSPKQSANKAFRDLMKNPTKLTFKKAS